MQPVVRRRGDRTARACTRGHGRRALVGGPLHGAGAVARGVPRRTRATARADSSVPALARDSTNANLGGQCAPQAPRGRSAGKARRPLPALGRSSLRRAAPSSCETRRRVDPPRDVAGPLDAGPRSHDTHPSAEGPWTV